MLVEYAGLINMLVHVIVIASVVIHLYYTDVKAPKKRKVLR